MTTIRWFRVCIFIFLTTFIFGPHVSAFELFDGAGEGSALIPARRADPEFILRIMLQSQPIFDQEILRKLKRSTHDNFEERSILISGITKSLNKLVRPPRNVHIDGLLRMARSVNKRSHHSIPRDGKYQDDEQRTNFMAEKWGGGSCRYQ